MREESTTIPRQGGPPEQRPADALPISATDPPASSPAATSGRTGLALAAASVCQLMVVLDISVVNVALPNIDRSLGFSASSLSWVVNAYTLAFGGLLLLGGRVADLLGPRRTMLGALLMFGVASALGGCAHTPGQLIAARGAQGVSAAVLSPVTLTVIMVTFPEGPARRRAVATWGMVATVGGALGVLVSGLLTQYLDWRAVLFVNVPLVIAAASFAVAALHDPDTRERVRLDLFGGVLATTSLTALAYGCVYAGEQGWGDLVTLSSLIGAVVMGLGFVAWELRSGAPLVRLSVLRTRAVWVAAVVIAFIGTASVAGFYFLSLFLQNVMGYGPVATGVAFLPFCAVMAVATMTSSRLVERFGLRPVLTLGLTLGALGMLGFGQLGVGAGYTGFLLASIVTASGLGVSIAPTVSMGTAGALRTEAGMVSGLINTSRQAGGGLALAVLATVASRVALGDGPGVEALAHGYQTALQLSGVLLLVAAAVAFLRAPRSVKAAQPGRG